MSDRDRFEMLAFCSGSGAMLSGHGSHCKHGGDRFLRPMTVVIPKRSLVPSPGLLEEKRDEGVHRPDDQDRRRSARPNLPLEALLLVTELSANKVKHNGLHGALYLREDGRVRGPPFACSYLTLALLS